MHCNPSVRGALTVAFALLLYLPALRADTADEDTGESAALAADWPMERVRLADGKKYEGLVRAESASGIEFVAVHRPPGKPMFLVVRSIDRANVAQLDRLNSRQQAELRERLRLHKRRTLVERGRMEGLVLSPSNDGGQVLWNYQGTGFSLECTANELMTRRLIVRLEQIFAAYRELVPPRYSERRPVEIRVLGSMEQYTHVLAELGLQIDNPAVYLPEDNLILAGSEVNRFDVELAKVSRQHREIKQRYDRLVADVPERVKRLGEELKRNNIPTSQRLRILLAEQRKWRDQRKAVQRKITALDRQNAAKFDEVTARMFRRLAHEAFHAYLETHVYPRQSYDVPRWLNEGLAQTFEAGLLEAGSLRVDAPNLVALAKLQDDLRGERPLALAELLAARSDTFLKSHQRGGESMSRAYYYSWGLAYYLAFDSRVLGSAKLDAYLSPAAAHVDPIPRFERLTGEPLHAFEARWRDAMLALKVE